MGRKHRLIPGKDKTFSRTAPTLVLKFPAPNAHAAHPTFSDQPGSLTHTCTCSQPCFHLHLGPHPGLSQFRARATFPSPCPDLCPSLAQVSCPLPQSFPVLRLHLLTPKVPTLERSVRVPTHCRIPRSAQRPQHVVRPCSFSPPPAG